MGTPFVIGSSIIVSIDENINGYIDTDTVQLS